MYFYRSVNISKETTASEFWKHTKAQGKHAAESLAYIKTQAWIHLSFVSWYFHADYELFNILHSKIFISLSVTGKLVYVWWCMLKNMPEKTNRTQSKP